MISAVGAGEATGGRPEGTRKILVATDFSSVGSRALDLAAAYAHVDGASITLLHVFEPPSVTIPELLLDPRLEQELRARAASELTATAAALRARGGTVEERLEVGAPAARVIADVATRIDADLVVLGSHGRRPLPRLLLGSVAAGALQHVTQPVLIVPEPAGDAGASRGPGPDGASGRRWRIAVGIDFSNSSLPALDWVRALRRRVACDLVFIHLYWPAAEYARYGLPGPRDLFEPDATTVGLLSQKLAPLVAGLPGSGEVTLRVLPSWGSPGERLADEAVREKVDLLVLGTHHRWGLSRWWHGDTTLPAVQTARIPILCVSKRAAAAPRRAIPRLRTVLAATDLSPAGNRSLAHAYALVRGERGATVHLVHVHEHAVPRPGYLYPTEDAGSLTSLDEQRIRAQILDLVPREAAELGIISDVVIADGGDAADGICQMAERLDADAIVVGSQGRGAVGRALLGSVAARVLHRADRPVFVSRYPVE